MPSDKNPDNLIVWIDLETTGLDPEEHTILEVACVITDAQLVERAAFRQVIWIPEAIALSQVPEEQLADQETMQRVYGVDAVVAQMHRRNGLWYDCANSTNLEHDVDFALAKFITDHGAAGAQLGGSTISFDREFMRFGLPETLKVLHYRNVSTFNETAKRFWPEVYAARPNALPTGEKADPKHRALEDIRESIAVARYYVVQLGPVRALETTVRDLREYDRAHGMPDDAHAFVTNGARDTDGTQLIAVNTDACIEAPQFLLSAREARVLAARLIRSAEQAEALARSSPPDPSPITEDERTP